MYLDEYCWTELPHFHCRSIALFFKHVLPVNGDNLTLQDLRWPQVEYDACVWQAFSSLDKEIGNDGKETLKGVGWFYYS